MLVSDDASATTLLLILIRDDDDDEFKFVRGLNIFSQPFFAATTTREQQRGVLLIIDFSDEEETEEEEIMLLLLLMMMPCALYRYIQRERKSAKLFFPLECSKSRSRALMNGLQLFPSSVCLSERQKAKRVFCRFRALSFSQRGFSERLVFWTTQEAKKASERERKRAKERAHPKKDRQTDRQKDPRQKDREI